MDDDLTVSKEQYNEIVEKLANETQSKANLVEEIKELREKKQITEAERDELLKKVSEREQAPAGDGEMSPEDIVRRAEEAAKKILSERDSEAAKENYRKAFEDFLKNNKEFLPENDEAGLKKAALERKLERFSLDGIKDYAGFMSVFEDARNLVVGTSAAPEVPGDNPNPLPPSGGGQSGHAKPAEDSQLSAKELAIVQRSFNGDKERYLKIKAKRPDYVASLLQYIV